MGSEGIGKFFYIAWIEQVVGVNEVVRWVEIGMYFLVVLEVECDGVGGCFGFGDHLGCYPLEMV